MKIMIRYHAKSFIKKSAYIFKQIFSNIFTIFIVLIKSNFFRNDFKKIKTRESNEFIVIGNGPSLSETLREDINFFKGKATACVNEFAMSEYFGIIKPDFYFFFDLAYWVKNLSDRNRYLMEKDFESIKEKVTWPMIIVMPSCAKRWNWFMDLPKLNKNVKFCYINGTVVNCSKSLSNLLYSKNLAIPRVQTVLVAALFLAINMGYRKIFLVGADHSWHEDVLLDEDNKLYVKDEHFYFEEKQPLNPVPKNPEETEALKIHEFFRGLSLVFEGHQEIAEYAKFMGAKVYNASKKTYIDAFERYKI